MLVFQAKPSNPVKCIFLRTRSVYLILRSKQIKAICNNSMCNKYFFKKLNTYIDYFIYFKILKYIYIHKLKYKYSARKHLKRI